MEDLRLVADLWPILVSIVVLIGYIVGLEIRQRSNARRLTILETKHDALDSKVVEQLASVRESLARIEGALGIAKPQG